MTEPEHSEIGRLLADAVPPLPSPADRIGDVRQRVRRSRQRAAASIAVAVALVAGLAAAPSLVFGDGSGTLHPTNPSPQLGPDGCPDETYFPYHGSETPVSPLADPDQFVPEGATEVMLCNIRVAGGELLGSQVLQVGADQLVAALNALPEADVSGLGCTLSYPVDQYSLILHYPDGATTAVYMDFNCRLSTVPGSSPRDGNVLDAFERLYEEQLQAAAPDPETIPTPECAETIGADRLDPGLEAFGPEPETIERPLGSNDPANADALPYPLVAATACRYVMDGDRAGLAASHPERDGLAGLRDALNDAFRVPVSDSAPRESECSQKPNRRTAIPDVILVADQTGGTAEFWVYDNPGDGGGPACWDVASDAEPLMIAAPAELVDYLLDTLGP